MKKRLLLWLLMVACPCSASVVSAQEAAQSDEKEIEMKPSLVYPEDDYSRPKIDHRTVFEYRASVAPWAPVVQRPQMYHENQINLILPKDGKGFSQWKFNRKAGQNAVPGIVLDHERLSRATDKVVMRVASHSEKPVQFALHMNDGFWIQEPEPETVVWEGTADSVLNPGEEKDIVFDISKMRPIAPTSRTQLLYPVALNFFITNCESETNYEFDFYDLAIHYPDPKNIDLLSIFAGQDKDEAVLGAWFSNVPETLTGNVDFEVRRNDHTLWRVRLDEAQKAELLEKKTIQLRRPIPDYLRSDEYVVGLVYDGFRIPETSERITLSIKNPLDSSTLLQCSETKLALAMPEVKKDFPKVECRMDNGRPMVFINGERFPWSGYSSYAYRPSNVDEFGKAGVNAFLVPVSAGIHVHGVAAQTWIAPGKFNFDELDERVAMALQANPDAKIALRVSLAPPYFWINGHPETLVKIRTPQGDLTWEETGTQAVSINSEAWRQDESEALRTLLRYCKEQPWADRVICVFPGGEVTEEWFSWASNDGQYADYSPVNEAAFAAWCKARGEAFDRIPDPELRAARGYDYYPSTQQGRWAFLYSKFNNETTGDAIEHFAQIVKEESNNNLLTLVFYAYVIQLAGEPRQTLSGHFALTQILESDVVDVVAGIPLHDSRDLTNGYATYCSASASLQKRNKIVFIENDLFSFLHNSLWYTPYDVTDPRDGAVKMHRRQLATNAVHNIGWHWFSLFTNWHHDEALLKEFSDEMKLFRQAADYDRTPTEEIALVVDDFSFASLAQFSTLGHANSRLLLWCLGRTGAPVNVWSFSTIDEIPDSIKCVIISSAPAPRAEDIEKFKAMLEAGGRTVIVMGPIGMINQETGAWDVEAPGKLLDLPIKIEDKPTSGLLFADADNKTLLGGCANLRPRAVSATQSVLHYLDGAYAQAERPLANGGKLIWWGAPVNQVHYFRELLADVGIHLYAPEGFSVHASRELTAITAPVSGEFNILWTHPAVLVDMFTNERFETGENNIALIPFEYGQTRLFHVESVQ